MLIRWRSALAFRRRLQRPRAFQFELFPLHSPLLRESLLVSFPPLSYMLKFSGFSYLVSGANRRGVGIASLFRRRGSTPEAPSDKPATGITNPLAPQFGVDTRQVTGVLISHEGNLPHRAALRPQGRGCKRTRVSEKRTSSHAAHRRRRGAHIPRKRRSPL